MAAYAPIPRSSLSPGPGQATGRGIALFSAALCLLLSSAACSAGQQPAEAPPRSVFLGGIGCGGFELLPDGRMARATINNNWERPIEAMRGCFAALWTRAGGRSTAQVLSTAPEYGLPGSAAIQFDGYFPRAELRFGETRLPVSITLRAYSALVPQDLKNSSLPAALFVFSVKNELRAPVEASVALSWENSLGIGGSARKAVFGDRTGNRTEMLAARRGIFGIRMSSPEKQIADPPHRLVYNARGTYALLASPTSPETVVSTAGWNALDSRPGWWERFAEGGVVESSVGPGEEGKTHPAGVVALKVSLKEGETIDLPFVVAWHTPRLYSLGGAEYGHYYEKSFDDAVEVGRYALENRQSLLALMDEWQNRLLRSSLPGWMARGVMNDAGTLFSSTILTRDGGLGGTEPGPYRFALLDRRETEPAVLGPVERRFFAQSLLLAWFPVLDLLELDAIVARIDSTGKLPGSLGDLETGFAPLAGPAGPQAPTAAPTPASTKLIASFAYQVAARYRSTGDQVFLDRFYPHVKHALESGAKERTAETGIDRDWWQLACSIGMDLAEVMRDRGFSRSCSAWIEASGRPEPGAPFDARQTAQILWMADTTHVTLPHSGLIRESEVIRVIAEAFHDLKQIDVSGAEDLFAPVLLSNHTAFNSADTALSWFKRILTRAPATEEDRFSRSASWNVLSAVTGVKLDLPTGRLTLAPALPGKVRNLYAPVYAPTFWATLDYRVSLSSSRLTFRLDRMMPANPSPPERQPGAAKKTDTEAEISVGLALKEIVLPTRPDRETSEITASVGRSPLPGTFSRRKDGLHVFTFATPLTVTVGQSLSFNIR